MELGGYKGLSVFIQTQIIHDFTMEFCRRYVRPKRDRHNDSNDYKNYNDYKGYKNYNDYSGYKSYNGYASFRTADQMEQAARSGKQNIPEGYAQGDFKSKLKLMKVARGSQEELLHDYLDFLRQKGLPLWAKDDPRAKKVRDLVYKINEYKGYKSYNNYNGYKNYNDYNSYKSYNDYNYDKIYNLYKPYLENPEEAANAMICLINQTNAMLNQKLKWTEENMSKEDAASPRERWLGGLLKKEREKEEEADKEVEEEMVKLGYKKLPDGRYVKKEEKLL